jgi:NADH:ubiquinone oxidoreductase subunit 6 (subunit J)
MIVSSPLHSYFFFKIDLINKLDFITNIETLGQILYTYYSIFFLMAGIILLIALIGAVALTKKEIRKKKLLQNNLFKQVSRNSFIAIFNTN